MIVLIFQTDTLISGVKRLTFDEMIAHEYAQDRVYLPFTRKVGRLCYSFARFVILTSRKLNIQFKHFFTQLSQLFKTHL